MVGVVTKTEAETKKVYERCSDIINKNEILVKFMNSDLSSEKDLVPRLIRRIMIDCSLTLSMASYAALCGLQHYYSRQNCRISYSKHLFLEIYRRVYC